VVTFFEISCAKQSFSLLATTSPRVPLRILGWGGWMLPLRGGNDGGGE